MGVYTPSGCDNSALLTATIDYPTSVGNNKYWKEMPKTAMINKVILIAIVFILTVFTF